MVPRVLLGDSRRYGLCAFEPDARVKKRALAATVQLGSATRTLCHWVNAGRQDGRTGSTSPNNALPWHHRSSRTKRFLLFLRPALAFRGIRVHVSPLFILPAHYKTSSLNLGNVSDDDASFMIGPWGSQRQENYCWKVRVCFHTCKKHSRLREIGQAGFLSGSQRQVELSNPPNRREASGETATLAESARAPVPTSFSSRPAIGYTSAPPSSAVHLASP